MTNLTTERRAMQGCGRVPPAQRTGCFVGALPDMDVDEYGIGIPLEICPGWLITLPQVQEAARAYGWRTMLPEFYDGAKLPRILFDAIDLFANEIGEVKQAQFDELATKNRGPQHGH